MNPDDAIDLGPGASPRFLSVRELVERILVHEQITRGLVTRADDHGARIARLEQRIEELEVLVATSRDVIEQQRESAAVSASKIHELEQRVYDLDERTGGLGGCADLEQRIGQVAEHLAAVAASASREGDAAISFRLDRLERKVLS